MSVTINVKANGRSATVVGTDLYETRARALETVAKLLRETKPTVQKVDKPKPIEGICDACQIPHHKDRWCANWRVA